MDVLSVSLKMEYTDRSQKELIDIMVNLVQFVVGAPIRDLMGFFSSTKLLILALPIAIRSEVELHVVSFKKKLNSFFSNRLTSIFNQDDIRFYKLVCVKCHHPNTTLFLLTFFSEYFFLLVFF